MPGPIALTGTPGTGKSAVARHLAATLRTIEVGELALKLGVGRRSGRGVVVDLPRLVRQLRRGSALREFDVVVGHLAHLLPLRDVVVLRCHPAELARRLTRARRGPPAERRANVEAEALDLVLLEAIRLGRRVWEIDTTGRRPLAVARDVARRFRRRGRSRYGDIDWLADPDVTEGLLDPGR